MEKIGDEFDNFLNDRISNKQEMYMALGVTLGILTRCYTLLLGHEQTVILLTKAADTLANSKESNLPDSSVNDPKKTLH
jgi:hypothetical protein